MLWFMMILFGGAAAFAFFLLSAVSAWAKRYILGLFFAVLELLSAGVSSGNWMYALKISGKSDWFLFGIFRYPLVGWICVSMFTVGIICAVVNGIGAVRDRRNRQNGGFEY